MLRMRSLSDYLLLDDSLVGSFGEFAQDSISVVYDPLLLHRRRRLIVIQHLCSIFAFAHGLQRVISQVRHWSDVGWLVDSRHPIIIGLDLLSA